MKDLIKKANQNVSKKGQSNSVQLSSDLISTKRLNLLGKCSVVAIYTLVVVVVASIQIKRNIETDLKATLSSIKTDQNETKEFIQNQFDKIAKDLQYSTKNLNIENRIIEHINSKMMTSKSKDSSRLQEQQGQIDKLKQKIQALLKLTDVPMKKDKVLPLKTLTYSQENYDILYFKHNQSIKRIREENKIKEEAFVSIHDMTIEENQKKLSDLKDLLSLQLYAKKRKLTSIREKFRKEKFINLVANF